MSHFKVSRMLTVLAALVVVSVLGIALADTRLGPYSVAASLFDSPVPMPSPRPPTPTAPEEVDAPGMDIQFGSELAEQLSAVDFNDNFVIIVFRGQLGGMNPSYAIDVLQVTRSGNRVAVRTHFGEPGPEEGALMSFSSPYHIITVPKKGTWTREIHFILEEDGKTVRKRTHFIP